MRKDPEKGKPYDSVFTPSGRFHNFPGGDKAVFITPTEAAQTGYMGRVPIPNGVIKPFEDAWEDWKEYWGIKKKAKEPEEIKRPKLVTNYRVGFDDELVKEQVYRRLQFYDAIKKAGISIERVNFSDNQLGLAEGRKIYVKQGLDADTEAAAIAHEAGHVLGEDTERGAYARGYQMLYEWDLSRAVNELRKIESGDPRLN